MGGLLDFLVGNGLLNQNGIGGPSSMNFGAQDQPQQVDPGIMAFAQAQPQATPQAQPQQAPQSQEQASIPQQAQPAQYRPQAQSPFLDSGTNGLQRLGAIMSPAFANQLYQRQLASATYNSYLQAGIQPHIALALVQNPQLTLNRLGIHQMGETTLPNGAKVANINNAGNIDALLPSNPALRSQIVNAPIKLDATKIGDISVPTTVNPVTLQATANFPSAAGPNGQGVSGLKGAMDLNNTLAQQKAAAEAQGKQQGTFAATLPDTLAKADMALQNIDAILKDKSLPDVVGGAVGRLPAIGGKQADLVNRIDQLKGESFLQGIQALKGVGRITNVEATRAEDAIARLNRVSSLDGFKSALSDLRSIVEKGRGNAQIQAGQEATAAPAQPSQQDQPPMEGARKAPDGHWYIQQGSKYFRVE